MHELHGAAHSRPAAALLDLLIPDRCAACDGPARVDGWCASCLEELPWLPAHRCAACGGPLTPAGRCTRCRERGEPWSRVAAALAYEGTGRALIGRWKYGRHAELTRPLRRALAIAVDDGWIRADGVVPVPQREGSWRVRGFSPSIDLAAHVAAALRVPRLDALERARDAPAQVGLTAAGRRRNVSRLFGVRRRMSRRLAGRSLLLVDDVVTTAATARACCAVLRAAGAREVGVVALARADERGHLVHDPPAHHRRRPADPGPQS